MCSFDKFILKNEKLHISNLHKYSYPAHPIDYFALPNETSDALNNCSYTLEKKLTIVHT